MPHFHLRRRDILCGAALCLAAPAIARAQAPVVRLRLHHFLSPVSNAHTRFLVPWARDIEKDSSGRIRIDLFPTMQLGGTAAQLYDHAIDGTADLVWTLPGLTPGRFPRIEVFELPFIADRRAVPNSRAVQELYETQLRDEFKAVHPICVFAHDQGVLHTAKPVQTMSDLKDMRVRAPTRLSAQALNALGANGITMPVAQVHDALARRVIDGCLLPWEVVPAVRVQDRVKHHAELAGSPTLYTATFLLAMNASRYAALPPDLKNVIDRHSGQAAAQRAARMWDDLAVTVEDNVRRQGNSVAQIEGAEAERWRKATEPVIAAWLAEAAKVHKFDGAALIAQARTLIAKYAG